MAANRRPELGTLTEGQAVMVRRSPNDMRGRPPEQRWIAAHVTKVARVWVTIEGSEGGWNRTWRMRLDTQDEASQYSGSNDSFATLEQHAWDETAAWAVAVLRDNETAAWAVAVLRDNGLTVEGQSPWRGREIELAEILSRAAQAAGAELPA